MDTVDSLHFTDDRIEVQEVSLPHPEVFDSRDWTLSINLAPGHPEHLGGVLDREQMTSSGPRPIVCPTFFSPLS